jgi:hypothetical protein
MLLEISLKTWFQSYTLSPALYLDPGLRVLHSSVAILYFIFLPKSFVAMMILSPSHFLSFFFFFLRVKFEVGLGSV